ncbi:putative lipoprotein [Labilithrix luteola]|uniref:Putative lipoprotein n=1 Tax=Labilithrix luteola TaxID=1391654 RepID=A0A0K1Q9Y3_9BACT|nr:putative lipoprotein [Labilithrix luteola]
MKSKLAPKVLMACGIAAFGVLVAFGCGGGASGVSDAKLPTGVRSSAIEHEACDESGNKVEVLDANNDGKPDIKRVSKNGREVCRISDLNHDGKPDMFEYFDETGQLRRREADYDDNGVVNSIEIYQGGKLVRRELDTSNQGKIDTWDTFDPNTGAPLKRERDSNGDGRVDQWWTYDGDKVSIAMDRNGDGLPDPDSTVVLGGSGAPTPSDAGAVAMADAATTPPPAPPSISMPSPNEPAPPVAVSDAGVVGKPQRGGAKR